VDGVLVGRLREGRGRLGLLGPAFAQFEAFLHIAHGGEILVQLRAVLGVHALGEAVRVVAHRVEDGVLQPVLPDLLRLHLLRIRDEQLLK